VYTVGSLAVGASSDRDSCCDPENDRYGHILKHSVPNALQAVSTVFRTSKPPRFDLTFSQTGLAALSSPLDQAPSPNKSSNPPRCDSTRSHMNNKNDDNAMEQPKSRLGVKYMPISSRHTTRNENNETQGTRRRIRMT
jgi:hypothetical protein